MKLYLRQATEQDVDLLFRWANDERVRDNSFCTEKIAYEDHVIWFRQLLHDKNRCQYIMEMKKDNSIFEIGQIRLTLDETEQQAEIGYSIDSRYRGRGYGKQMLHLLVTEMYDNYPEIKRLIARVKTDNIASYKVFAHGGFVEKYKELEYDLVEHEKQNEKVIYSC